jgi:hypothetical protein
MRKRLFGNPVKRKAILKGKKRRLHLRQYQKRGFSGHVAIFLANMDELRNALIKAGTKMVKGITKGWHL